MDGPPMSSLEVLGRYMEIFRTLYGLSRDIAHTSAKLIWKPVMGGLGFLIYSPGYMYIYMYVQGFTGRRASY